MSKGTPLPPEVAEGIGELYAKLGNLSEVARTLNLPFETVRDVVARGVNARRRQLLEAALNLGLEEGADHLRTSAMKLREVLLGEIDAGKAIALDPQGMRDLGSVIASLVGTQARVRDSLERGRTAKFQRRKLAADTERSRAEAKLALAQTKVFEAKALESASPEEVLKKLTVDELLALLARIRAERAAAKEVPEKG